MKQEPDAMLENFELNKEKNTIIKYTGNEEHIAVPEGITSIMDGVFKKQKKLESIALPSTLKTIGNYAFADCDRLKAVTFSDGLISML